MTYRFADGALAEFIAAGKYYNRRVPGLGDKFVDEVEQGIKIILDGPFVWRVMREDVRRYLIKRFPYGIYYSVDGDTVVIWAVMDLRRKPDYWLTRRLG